MTDDRLLKELARLAREQQAKEADTRWDALAAGTLSPEEVERLREEARTSPEAAAAWELFRPMEADFRSEVVQQARQSLGAAPAAPTRAAAPARVLRPRSWWQWAVPAALAASLMIVVLGPWRGGPALPSYEIRLSGATRTLRSASPEPRTGPAAFADGNRFELVLTPESSAGEDVEARAFVVEGDRLRELQAPAPSRSSDGAVRIAGVVGQDVPLPRGEFTLLVAVGRPGSLPSPEELRARLVQASSVRESRWAGWKLRLSGAPPP
jgi:hypothetical protein